ncbi:MAG: cation:proton antiporter [Candidatus Kryptonium sp.]|nr:cation:proton antiporter [Candidatus Kryptonium sp.]MCX7762526.1 cation:proton antiporter [Candidatus Kryptonium sp.]MDW8108228.1 cation:proton antiporter [Candidatus Kryptonium sp.]
MGTEEFLKTFVVIFGLSVLIVYFLHRIRVPSIIGFLISGIIAGPYGIRLVKDVNMVEIFAEIGVVLLLFVLGIELSPAKLFEMRRFVFLAGGLQLLFTSFLVVVLSSLFLPLKVAVFAGVVVALSSTAIILKYLVDKGEVDTPHGKVIIGILIFQDLIAVLATGFVPFLSGENFKINEFLLKIALSVLIVFVVLWASRKLVPVLLFQIVKSRIRDLFIVSVLFLCFSVALIISEIGFSLAFGAFLAGLLISESEYAHQVTADIIPFRESFMAIFFISIGMLFNADFIGKNLFNVVIISALVMLIKLIGTFASVALAGGGSRVSLISAFALSQISEFSFVLILLGKAGKVISEDMYNLFISVSIITMILSPILLVYAPRISQFMEKHIKLRGKLFEDVGKVDKFEDHVIIVGFGLNGRNVAKALRAIGVPYVILELNIVTVKKMREQGERIYHGDATSVDVLRKVGIDKARLIVVVISDPVSARKIVSLARFENPNIYIIVRTRYVTEIEELKKLGANEVIPEEFETSIEIISRVLNYFNLPMNLVKEYASQLRKDTYKALRGLEVKIDKLVNSSELLRQIDITTFIVGPNSRAKGRSISELNLKNQTGVLIIAVQRGDEIITNPSSDFVFEVGDIMFVIGNWNEIERAIEFLEGEQI